MLSWPPPTLVILACAAFCFGAYLMNTCWWVETDPQPSSNQEAPDGSSMFGSAGVDYFTRTGLVHINVGPGSPRASSLGFAPNGRTTISPLIPLRFNIEAPEGQLAISRVSTVSVTI